MARWYVRRNGEVGGPYPEQEVRLWVRSRHIGAEASVLREFAPAQDQWAELQESPFEHLLPNDQRTDKRRRAERRRNALLIGLPMGIVAVVGALVFFGNRPVYDPDAGRGPVPQIEPPRSVTRCALSIPGSSDPVPVFPTEEGMDEFGAAAAAGDDQAMRVALTANRAVLVTPRTKCAWLDLGIVRTRVRVVDGVHSGAAGWVPSEWARGN